MKKIIFSILVALLISATQKPETVWVAIGDSITYLNDHPNETNNRVKKGYITRVTEKLSGIKYINKGYNGWKSTDIADKIDRLELLPADIYTVFLGTNDWWSGVPTGLIDDYVNNTGNKTLYGSFRIIIDKLRSLNGNARIILMTPLQRGDFVYYADYKNNAYGSYKNNRNSQSLADFAEAIRNIGAYEHIGVVDLYNKSGITQKNMVKFKRLKDASGAYKNYKYPDFTEIPFSPDDEYPYPPEAVNMTYDGLHPSDKGCAVIAKMLVKEIRKPPPTPPQTLKPTLTQALTPTQALKPTPEEVKKDRARKIVLPLNDGHYKQVKDYVEDEPDADYLHASEEAHEAFRDIKYSIRIHWGVYAMQEIEASWPFLEMSNEKKQEYQELYKNFNPAAFDADEWMAWFKNCGMQAFAFTTKHHDGFSMFHTKTKVKQRANYLNPET
ncbi:MAG: alpha-L-fucosidase, partial [Tannerella sp.]|nr:alpha-L-fucosidase [Tannerella sp.]